MNSIVRDDLELLHETQAIRTQLLDSLTDADLAYKLAGDNLTLGGQCLYMGNVQQNYVNSFKTFKLDWKYRQPDESIITSVERLRAWYKAMDEELDAALHALTDETIQTQMIDRGWAIPIHKQFHVYREALLMFYAKASLYLRALGKPLPQQMRDWIG